MLIHHAPDGVWTGQSREIGERDPVPPGLIMTEAPPPVPEGKVAMWADGWVITDPPTSPALSAEAICRQIDAERDRRIDGGFEYMGHRFQSRATDRENIAGLGADAVEAIRDGAQAGDYFWHPEFPQGFGFITEANITVPMDAFQTRGVRAEGIGFKARLTLHARDLKDAVLAAEDPSSVDIMTGWPA